MYAALAAGASHPAVAAWLALGTAGLAAAVVAMAWSVNTRQIRLAEQLAKHPDTFPGMLDDALSSVSPKDRG